MNDALGNRMKENYEKIWLHKLTGRMPVIIRVDGKAFHTYTKGLTKPFDLKFIALMNNTAIYLCENIQNAMMAFVQSDEISILVNTYKKLETSPWFDNEIQKIASISASMAGSYFTKNAPILIDKDRLAIFDGRCFTIPREEVCNYFIWRQKDWERNSIQMLARKYYSQKELNGKNCQDMHEMLYKKKDNWNNLEVYLKRGRAIIKNEYGKWIPDMAIPKFTENRDYVNRYLTETTEEIDKEKK